MKVYNHDQLLTLGQLISADYLSINEHCSLIVHLNARVMVISREVVELAGKYSGLLESYHVT